MEDTVGKFPFELHPKSQLQSSESLVDLCSFPCFPSLPAEIRARIWKFVSSHQRNIHIGTKILLKLHYGRFNGVQTKRDGDFIPFKYFSTTSPPALLGVDQEARIEGLKYYRKEFGTRFQFDEFTFSTPATVYINFEVDRVCLLHSWDGLNGYYKHNANDFFKRCLDNGARYMAIKLLQFHNIQSLLSGLDYFKAFLAKRHEILFGSKTGREGTVEEVIIFAVDKDPDSESLVKGTIGFEDMDPDWKDSNDLEMRMLKKWRVELFDTDKYGEENVALRSKFKNLTIDGKRCLAWR